MSWTDDVKEIERQRRMAEEMGGADSVAFQHGRGKLTVRERIDLFADPGSFHEIGALTGTATWEDGSVAQLKPSNMVVGTVRVDGRKVAFSGGDFTIRGGASDASIGNKSRFAEEFALRSRLPFVRLLDATGGSVKTFEQIGRTYLPGSAGTDVSTQLLQAVPVVSAVLGSVAGLPAVQARHLLALPQCPRLRRRRDRRPTRHAAPAGGLHARRQEGGRGGVSRAGDGAELPAVGALTTRDSPLGAPFLRSATNAGVHAPRREESPDPCSARPVRVESRAEPGAHRSFQAERRCAGSGCEPRRPRCGRRDRA